jgi:putative colanic acid biosynthesis UDP-glucose lipid carrier transferase
MDDEYALLFGDYVCRTRVRPGITGWAQVNGQRGATLSTASMAARLELDLFYIQHWSFWLDLLILLKTIATVMRGINAY